MSVQTIKGSRQKTASGYSDYLPFGADGKYIDMLSGLDLEKQLKLGGDHSASIRQVNGNTVITEKYADDNAVGAYYKVVTTISESEDPQTGTPMTTITSQLYWVDNQGDDVLKNTKTITIQEDGNEADITEVLS